MMLGVGGTGIALERLCLLAQGVGTGRGKPTRIAGDAAAPAIMAILCG
jgi:hypothetical protein